MKPLRTGFSKTQRFLGGGQIPTARVFVVASVALILALAVLSCLTGREDFFVILSAGVILYAAFHYPPRVFLALITLTGLGQFAALYFNGDLRPDHIAATLFILVCLVALGYWTRSLTLAREAARHELRESEERYRTFVQHFQGIAIKGRLNGELVFVHGAVEAITGYDAQDFLSGQRRWSDIVHPDDRALLAAGRGNETSAADFTRQIDYRILHKNGETRWVHDNVTVLADENGKPVYFQVAIYDITARRQAEEAVRQSEARFRTLFVAMQEGFALFQPVRDPTSEPAVPGAVIDYRVINANPAFESALRLEPGHSAGASLVKLFPSIWPGLLNAFEEVLTTGQPQQIETYLAKNDSHLQIRFFLPVTGQVAMLLSDITERKRIEAALKESQAHFRTLFDNSPVALWDEDFSQVKRMVDELKSRGVSDVRAYLQTHPDETARMARAIGLRDVNLAAIRLMGAPDRSALVGNLSHIMRGQISDSLIEQVQAISTGQVKFEWEGINDIIEGEPRAHRVVWSVAPGSEKSYTRVIVAIEDVTGRKRAEEALVHLSSHDTLTGLYNRTYFDAEMERLSKSRLFPVTIFFADIDGLKQSNDTLGHHVGDQLLRRTARVLRQAFRAEDIVARIGGDEIGVLLPNAGEEAAQTALARIEQLLEVENASRPIPPLSFSIGYAVAQKGDDLREVLRRADEAMYREKHTHRQA